MIRPLDMQPVGDSEVLLSWEDGHRSLFRYHDLRLQCPCAECRDEWTGERRIKPSSINAAIRFSDVTPVGHYGVRLRWSDGHQTGIYSFDYLRGLCPCVPCAAARQEKP